MTWLSLVTSRMQKGLMSTYNSNPSLNSIYTKTLLDSNSINKSLVRISHEIIERNKELESIILDKDQEILDLKDELRDLKDETSKIVRENTHTEEYVLKEKAINSGYELKEKAMDNILKLVSIQDVSNLSRE